MKKFLSVLLMVVFLFPILSFGESFHFSFRNGVEFGDSIADVKTKEDKMPDREDSGLLYYGSIQLSSIGHSALNYNFTDGELSLILIDYNQNYGGREEAGSRQEEYSKINEGRIRKYGEPSASDEENADEIPTGAFYWYKNYYESKSHIEKALDSVNQWVLEDQGYNVVIQHVLFEVDSSDWGLPHYYVHFLSYQKVEMDDNRTDEINSIVDNDL